MDLHSWSNRRDYLLQVTAPVWSAVMSGLPSHTQLAGHSLTAGLSRLMPLQSVSLEHMYTLHAR